MRKFLTTIVAAALIACGLGGVLYSQGLSLNGMANGSITNPTISGQTLFKGIYFNSKGIGFSGHLESGAAANTIPALSTCGTSPVLATGSTDTAGLITVGTSASNACTLTFGTAYTAAPFCVVQNSLTGAAANVYAVSTTAIVWSSALADSSTLFYHCIARSGG